jgi:hypothetical protein
MMMKASFYGEFRSRLVEFSRELDLCKAQLKKEYPSYVEAAREKLNGMFVAENYPDVRIIDSKFGMSVDFQPVVAPGDFRLELDAELMKTLQDQHTKSFQESQVAMTKELWNRVYNTVLRAAKLANGKAKIYDSLFSDLDELAEALPSLNMLDDPEVDKMAKAIREELGGRDAHIIRVDPAERIDMAAKAQKMIDKMAKFIR